MGGLLWNMSLNQKCASLVLGKVLVLLCFPSSELRRNHKSCPDKGSNGDILNGKPLALDFISSTAVEGTQ